jgi:N6-adenosine-specific RNA methylase IME4
MISRRTYLEPLFGKAGRFRVLAADPPWNERGAGKIPRGAQKHYPLIKTTDEIIHVMRSNPLFDMHDDSHCYLWVTNTFLEQGLIVMRALDFRYVTNLVWPKRQFGLGRYFRNKHELCLFGVRGQGMAQSVFRPGFDIDSLIDADHVRGPGGTRIHSRKPEAFFEKIERRSHGPYLEMFSRRKRPGWTVTGNEVDHAA